MGISLDRVGKRYHDRWILRGVDLRIEPGMALALLGPNGIGKSTLLLMAAGLLRPSEGLVSWTMTDGQPGQEGAMAAQVAFAAPYVDFPEELPLNELIRHHFRFRPLRPGVDQASLPELWQLATSTDRPVRTFSSGMKQRVRLGLNFWTDVPFLFLDEPLTNLDESGKAWFDRCLAAEPAHRCRVIASNREDEVDACGVRVDVREFAPGHTRS